MVAALYLFVAICCIFISSEYVPRASLLIIVVIAAIIFIGYLPSKSVFANVLPGASQASLRFFFSTVQSGFPRTISVMEYYLPFPAVSQFANELYFRSFGTKVVAVVIGVSFYTLLFTLQKSLLRNRAESLTLFLGMLFASVSWVVLLKLGFLTSIYLAIPEFMAIDFPWQLFPIALLSSVMFMGVVIDELSDKSPKSTSTGVSSIGHRYTSRRRIRLKIGKRHILRGRKQITIVLALLVLGSGTLAALPYTNFVSASGALVPYTYSSGEIQKAAAALQAVKRSSNVTSGLDLWLPAFVGVPTQDSVLLYDPAALFFAATAFHNSSLPYYQSYYFLYYTLKSLVSNHTTHFGSMLATLGVSNIVLLLQTPKMNPNVNISQFNNVFVNGLFIANNNLGWLIGSPKRIQALLGKQSDLNVVESSNQSIIYSNSAYHGVVSRSSSAILMNRPGLENGSNGLLSSIYSLPSFSNSSPPIILSQSISTGTSVTTPSIPYYYADQNRPVTELTTAQRALDFMNAMYISSTYGGNTVGASDSPNGFGTNISEVTVRNEGTSNISAVLLGGLVLQNNSLLFTGENQVQLSNNSSKQLQRILSPNYTLNVWIKPSILHPQNQTPYVYQDVLSQGGGGVLLTIVNSYVQIAQYYSLPPNNTASKSIFVKLVPGVWYMISVTFNGTLMSAFINGTLTASIPVPAVRFSDAPYTIGNSALYPDQAFHGMISDLSMYNSSLDIIEINALYNEGRISHYATNVTPFLYLPLDSGDLSRVYINFSFASLNEFAILLNGLGNYTVSYSGQARNLSLDTFDAWVALDFTGPSSSGNGLLSIVSTSGQEVGTSALYQIIVLVGSHYGEFVTGTHLIQSSFAIQSDQEIRLAPILNSQSFIFVPFTYDSLWSLSGASNSHFSSISGNVFFVTQNTTNTITIVYGGKPMIANYVYYVYYFIVIGILTFLIYNEYIRQLELQLLRRLIRRPKEMWTRIQNYKPRVR
ncbi:MAG: LamG domain-containing protein [Nitrososphaerota archaeon]|nr:LamG domain-containing protein [Nitrososphaerota archaeon]